MVCVREIQLFNNSKELRRDPYMRKNSPQVVMRDTREGGFEIEEEQGALGIEAESPVDGRININDVRTDVAALQESSLLG